MLSFELLKKYNVPVPRYTSYPTVPHWQEHIHINTWENTFRTQYDALKEKKISLYLHLPFCESLCTYCGCNKKITTNHSVEAEYIDTILKEWALYKQRMNPSPTIKEIHIGGGTPTFFSADNLKYLLTNILEGCNVAHNHEFSVEGHPNNTTEAHLQTLFDLGFRRISYGVQDLDPAVQFIINRIQPFENVKRATEKAREIGFTSVNFDLIYGLPKQNEQSLENTLDRVISLRPDRIAFYSYAHVPWTSKGQRLFDEHDLPSGKEKLQLYMLGKKLLGQHGYYDIGMDHFALPHDELYIASAEGRLHRNFMGYTTSTNTFLIGLGVSAISDINAAYAQNAKTIHDYYNQINKGELAITKGYFLSDKDIAFRRYILDISCKGATSFQKADIEALIVYSFPKLQQMEEDDLITMQEHKLEVTPLGRNFIRNICSAFDLHLLENQQEEKKLFSNAV